MYRMCTLYFFLLPKLAYEDEAEDESRLRVFGGDEEVGEAGGVTTAAGKKDGDVGKKDGDVGDEGWDVDTAGEVEIEGGGPEIVHVHFSLSGSKTIFKFVALPLAVLIPAWLSSTSHNVPFVARRSKGRFTPPVQINVSLYSTRFILRSAGVWVWADPGGPDEQVHVADVVRVCAFFFVGVKISGFDESLFFSSFSSPLSDVW
jgi:hypothetical protein